MSAGASRPVDGGPGGGRHVDGDVADVLSPGQGVPDSQARTSAALRPSTWPSRPPVPSASTNPVCRRSRVSSSGAGVLFPAGAAAAGLVDAQHPDLGQRCLGHRRGCGAEGVHHHRPGQAQVTSGCTTVEPASRTLRPARARNRVVSGHPPVSGSSKLSGAEVSARCCQVAYVVGQLGHAGGVGGVWCRWSWPECGAGDLVPDGEAVGHLGAVGGSGHPVAAGAEVR